VNAVTEIPFFDTSAIASGDWELEEGWEVAFSSSAGWPRAVAFYQGRLWFGGTSALPTTVFGSRVGSFYDFRVQEGLDDEPIIATLDTGQLNQILRIVPARELQIFTQGSEFIVVNALGEPLTPANFVVKQQTSQGMKENVPPAIVQGGTFYIQREGAVLNEFIYNDPEGAYVSSNISLLSSHLLKTPVDMAARITQSTDEGDLICVVNDDDGTMAVFAILRSQKLVTPVEWVTNGEFIGVGVDVDDIYVAVARTDSSVTKYYIEVFDSTVLLDSAKTGSSGTGVSMAHITGQEVEVIVDGYVEAEQTVSGTVTFENEATSSYQVGLDFDVEIKTMPAIVETEAGVLRQLKKRVLRVDADLLETQSLTIDGKHVSFRTMDEFTLDSTVQEYTGLKTLEGMLGWDYDGQITIGQDAPLKMNLLALNYLVSVGV